MYQVTGDDIQGKPTHTWSLLMRNTFPSISSSVRLSVATDSSDSRWGSVPAPKPAVLVLATLPERVLSRLLSRPALPICPMHHGVKTNARTHGKYTDTNKHTDTDTHTRTQAHTRMFRFRGLTFTVGYLDDKNQEERYHSGGKAVYNGRVHDEGGDKTNRTRTSLIEHFNTHTRQQYECILIYTPYTVVVLQYSHKTHY